MKKGLIFLLLVFCFQLSKAQFVYTGEIKDSLSKQPLAFVNVLASNSLRGTTSDIDGKFKLLSRSKLDSLRFSYLGYAPKTISAESLKKQKVIYLQQTNFQLKEVEVLAGENPAHRLIQLAVQNRDLNNPEKSTEFYYESYNKLIITGDLDSNILLNQDSIQKLDSNDQAAYKLFNKQHLFMMESVSERNHIPPDNSKELVLASRVSGLKNPMFSLIGTQLQSFSFYSNYINLFGNNYLSPISKGSINKYLFELTDTILQEQDSIFLIRFQPRKGKNFEALKGVLYLNTNGYAIQNIIAEPVEKEMIEVKIQQKYEQMDGNQWFPVQLNTNLIFHNIELNGYNAIGIGRSYLKNIQLESKLKKGKIGNTILSLDPEAGEKDESYWESYRLDSLDAKERETYRKIDSIGDAENFDEKMKLFRTFVTGSIPWGKIDLPIKHFMDYNDYEGFRLGVGAETNDKFIRNFRIGGYGAYGFKDRAFKYGGYAKWEPKSDRLFKMQLSYSNDVVESGGVDFVGVRTATFSNEGLKKLYINQMDGAEKYQFDLGFRALRDFRFTFIGNYQDRTINSNYKFVMDPKEVTPILIDNFTLVETAIDIRYSFKEKYMEMFGMKFPVETKYPVVHLRLTQGFDSFLEGEFEYQRIDAKIDQSILWKGLGLSSIRIAGGLIEGDVPLTAQYRTQGTYSDGLLLATEYSFETVRPNEFYSDRYANFFFRHNFKSLLYKGEKFRPELTLLASYGIGDLLQTKQQHRNVNYKTLEHGLIETGMQINKLLNFEFTAIGIAGYYRLGAYSSEKWEENAVVKLSAVFSF